MAFSKSDIELILNSPAQVSRAIEILGNNQRDDELSSRSTNTQNGIGFTSCWASAGTHLWQFVTGYDARSRTNKWGRKCLSHPNWKRAKIIRRKVYNNGCENAVQLGRKIALHHWRQLGEMLPTQPVLEVKTVSAPEPEVDYEAIMVPADKVDMALAILKAAGVL
tara:strand:- start:327 stop:821 length:495 start_codon:yes stop_codon:yes gene_type:complete